MTIHDIILLGDIKHNIPTSTIQERTDVKRFLEDHYDVWHASPYTWESRWKHRSFTLR